MSQQPDPISSFFASYADAVLRKDASAFASLYAPDVVVFDAWDTWRQVGSASVLAMATAWFESLGTQSVHVSFSKTASTTTHELAHASAFVTYSATSLDGAPLRELVNRASFTLSRANGLWKVVHEHTSVPVGFMSKLAVPFTAAESGA